MSTSRGRKEATYEDILALPPYATGQIVDGELHVAPRPAKGRERYLF